MDLVQTIEGMETAGVRLRFEAGRLSIEADADRPPSADLLAAIQRHKDALRSALAAPSAIGEDRTAVVEAGLRRNLRPKPVATSRQPRPGEPEKAQDAEPLDLSPRALARWRRRRLRDAERDELAAMLAFGDPRARNRR